MEAIPKESTQRVGNFDDYAFEEDSKEDQREFEDLKERMSKLGEQWQVALIHS